MNTKEHLEAAISLIDTEDKWSDAGMQSGGCLCALGAIAVVAGYERSGLIAIDYRELDKLPAVIALAETIRKNANDTFFKREGCWLHDVAEVAQVVWVFNDSTATTHADVIAMMKKAAAEAA